MCGLLLVKLGWEPFPLLIMVHPSVGWLASEKDSSTYFWKFDLIWESNDRIPQSLIKNLDTQWTFQRCFSLALIVSSSLQDLPPPFEGCIYFLERKAKQNKIHHFDGRPSASAHDLGPKHSCLCRTQLLFWEKSLGLPNWITGWFIQPSVVFTFHLGNTETVPSSWINCSNLDNLSILDKWL